MPVEQENVVNIVCDNPACPGNSLDPTDRTGWTFVTSEVYGFATSSSVFCSPGCAGTITDVLIAEDEARAAAAADVPPPLVE